MLKNKLKKQCRDQKFVILNIENRTNRSESSSVTCLFGDSSAFETYFKRVLFFHEIFFYVQKKKRIEIYNLHLQKGMVKYF